MSPEELVKRSQVIVRATALGYFRPPVLPRAGRGPTFPRGEVVLSGTVRFRVDSVIKGKWSAPTVELEGRVADQDDYNDEAVPYRLARKSPDTYVRGAEYLLMLREKGDGYDVSWAAPSASNEQIRSADDPWLRWVSERVKKESR